MALTPKERKANQTQREKYALERLGGRRLKFIAYGATLAALDLVCEREGFTGRQRYSEALTFLAHDYENRAIVSAHEGDLPND